MFESSLISRLSGDTGLVSYLSTYNTSPSIFSEFAPEAAVMPYLIIRIDRLSTDNVAVHDFNIYLDYFDYDVSAANSRKASERIEYLLDYYTMEHDRYSSIRLRFESGGSIIETDPRTVRYNCQVSARGCRKKWSEQL